MPEDNKDATVWYASKTLWVNVVALIGIIVQGVTGKMLIGLEVQASILSVINILLRMITKKPISWS